MQWMADPVHNLLCLILLLSTIVLLLMAVIRGLLPWWSFGPPVGLVNFSLSVSLFPPFTEKCFHLRMPVTALDFQAEHSSLIMIFLYAACGFLPPISTTTVTGGMVFGHDSEIVFLWHSVALISSLSQAQSEPGRSQPLPGRILIFTFLRVAMSLLLSGTHGDCNAEATKGQNPILPEHIGLCLALYAAGGSTQQYLPCLDKISRKWHNESGTVMMTNLCTNLTRWMKGKIAGGKSFWCIVMYILEKDLQ